MNETKLKIITTLVKIAGVLTAAAGAGGALPEKYQWVGLAVTAVGSTLKDVAMWLGDLWDDGTINKSYKP